DDLGIEPGARLRGVESGVLAHDPSLAPDTAAARAAPAPREAAPSPAVPAAQAAARRVVTVVVADLADADALAARLDPESLDGVLERFAATCGAVLEQHGAAVDRGAGEAIAGVFGLSVRHEDDPLRAARAALALRDELSALADALGEEHDRRPAIGIGVASGEVFVGSGRRARGEAVHLAAALARAAPGGEVLLGDDSRVLSGAGLRTEVAAPLIVRGRRAPVVAWRLTGLAVDVPAPADGPFIARDRELDALRAALHAAGDDGSCRRVTVVGPPGIGKSRLARELIADLGEEAGVTVGRCHADPGAAGARPLAQLVRGVTGESPDEWIRERLADDERSDVIVRRVRGVLGLSDEPAQPGETAWAVRRVLEAAARDQPLLVVIDDAHWGDATLLDLVEYTLAFSGGGAILLLCLARPELLDARPGWAAPHADNTLLQLEPLGKEDARALVDAIAEGLGDAAAARIVATAEGNPMFLEQLLAVRAEGDLTTLPPSIEAVLAARIDGLDPHEREVLRHASLEGRRFHVRATAALLPREERDALDRALIGLVQKQLIRPDRPEFAGEDAFRFSHALIREAAYAGMPKRLRGELHERLADWLRAKPRVADETIGVQLEQAWRLRRQLGPPDQHDRALAGEAADRLAAAGRAELRRGDVAVAGGLLDRAVALTPAEDPARAGLLIQLGATLIAAGRLADAEQRLDEAISLAARDGDPLLAARARVELELARQHAGHGTAEADRIVDAALAEFERHGDERGCCRAWQVRAMIEWTASRAAAADDAWRHAATHARRADDEREHLEILGWRASAAVYGPTPVPEAIRRCEAIRDQSAGSPVAVAIALRPLAFLHAMTGDFARARELSREANGTLAELVRMEDAVSHHDASVELLAGRADEAEARLRPGFEALGRMGERNVYATTAALLAEAVYAQQRPADAAALCAESERCAAPEDVVTQAMWRGVRAKLLAADGEFAAAEALAEEAVTLIAASDLLNDHGDVLLARAEVLRLAGRDADAGRIREQAVELYERKGNLVSAARARSWPTVPAPA
ncbi:MAG: AAA family ATPase, partial [Solirubrobacteraceae bacterium]